MDRRKFLRESTSVIAGLCFPYRAIGAAADKELIFCLDWSDSMYDEETRHYVIQRDGHVAALKDPDIVKLFLSQKVYVAALLWSGVWGDDIRLIFSGMISTKQDLEGLAAAIESRVPKISSPSGDTWHNTPLEFISGKRRIGKKRIIDLSTDQGITSRESQVKSFNESSKLYRHLMTTVNVLAIGVNKSGVEVLRQAVQTPDGFTLDIENWKDYVPAIRKKIIKELMAV